MSRVRLDPVPRRRRLGRRIGACAIVALLAATSAGAQDSGRGYLLATPIGSLSLRLGYDRAVAGSDLFSEANRLLTVSKSDFGGLAGAVDVGVRLNDRLDVVLGTGYAGSDVASEYREFVDNDDRPIEQTTRFQRVPISASIRGYLLPRGRSIGRFAWVPARVSPYVGAGGGLLWHRFRQSGDFVDFDTENLRVFSATFESSKWTTQAHALAGIDYSLNPRVALASEARYTWGRATLDRQYFAGFEPIDLSGVAVTAGLSVRF